MRCTEDVMIKVSLQQMQVLLSALRNSTKQFQVTYRDNGSEVTFRARYSASPTGVKVEDGGNFNFYQWKEPGQADGLRIVPQADLVRIRVSDNDYVVS
jgi:hypothetical protein